MLWMTLAALGAGCAANDTAALTDEVEALKRRVATLEQKVKRLEGGKGGKAPAKGGKNKGGKNDKAKGGKGKTDKSKGGKGKTDKSKGGKGEKSKQPAADKGTVKVTGDAVKVMLADAQRKWAVPNQLAAGPYVIMAAFGEEKTLSEVGTATVVAGQTVTVSCAAATRTCTAQ
jgi:hypothetical protein